MKKAFFTVVYSLFVLHGSAQWWHVEAGIGYGRYAMSQPKAVNEALCRQLPIHAEITDNYPGTGMWTARWLPFHENPLIIGFVGTYNTTGSRISYADFSGEYRLDQLAHVYSTGLFTSILLEEGRSGISLTNQVAYAFTRLRFEETLLSLHETYRFTAGSILLEPGVRFTHKVWGLEFALSTSYVLDFKGILYLKEDHRAYMVNPDTHKKVHSDWSGIRIALSVGILKE
jgi:hypothetical protein